MFEVDIFVSDIIQQLIIYLFKVSYAYAFSYKLINSQRDYNRHCTFLEIKIIFKEKKNYNGDNF